MTIDETIDIFEREKSHCEEHLHFVGKSEEYYKDIQDLIDAYDVSIKMLGKTNKLKDCISRKEVEKLKKYFLSYDTNTTIPKADLFVKIADIRELPSVTPKIESEE